jgi:hypothetical protein
MYPHTKNSRGRIAVITGFVTTDPFAPGIGPSIYATGGLFPLRLRGQTLSTPFAVCFGLIPIDINHGVVIILGIAIIAGTEI